MICGNLQLLHCDRSRLFLSLNYIASICSGFVEQQVVQQVEAMELGPYCLLTASLKMSRRYRKLAWWLSLSDKLKKLSYLVTII